MSKKHTVSLSRAHKLAERLTRHIDKCSSEMEGKTRYVPAQVPAQAERATLIREELEILYKEQDEAWEALVEIREAISKANEKVGIHSRLSAYKARHRQLCSMESLLEGSLRFLGGVSPCDAVVLLSDSDKDIHNVNINVIDDVFIAALKDDISLKRNELDKLNDDVNDLNASTKVSVTLSKRVATIVGL